MTELCPEKYAKRLIGRTDIEDALKMLDKLTHEEAWMGIAQNLRATHILSEGVGGVDDRVRVVDHRVADLSRGA